MEFGKHDWKTFEQGIQKEWLLTNGIGGFSCSTVIGANTRRYHGLLVASLKPPVERHLILSKLDESIFIGNRQYDLYTNQTTDYISRGYLFQQRFKKDIVPAYFYSVEDVLIEKRICMVYGQNKTVIVYKVMAGEKECKFRIAPLVNFRDYHFNSNKDNLGFEEDYGKKGITLKPRCADVEIFVNTDKGRFIKQEESYFLGMFYAIEHERGLHAFEDHYIPGFFDITVAPGKVETITITAGMGTQEQLDGMSVIRNEEERVKALVAGAGYNEHFADTLVKACDQFIVKRESTRSKTVIAGYPWFTDWGRDTMIALPGLTLATKRYEDARDILYTFSKYIRYGLVPNMFPDTGQEPGYNTVDAALWYFNAVHKYIKYTGDYDFVEHHLYEKLKEMIHRYIEGTLHDIKMDQDALIYAGNSGTQLTWMDAKIGDWVVTPRYGKTVEINALWYHALKVMAYIADHIGDKNAAEYEKIASRTKESFEKSFWNDAQKCLYDVINENEISTKVRPNQIIAVSLDYPVIDGEKAQSVVKTVWQQLYTTYGLRSLAPLDGEYRGVYIGNQYERDSAYHQGTAWSWLMGSFVTAYRKVFNYSEESRKIAAGFILPFRQHLKDACIGSVSEIFDGDSPNIPRGCFAQAWGVAEVLRAYVEEVIGGK